MEVALSVLADYANLSREGKLNIMGIFGRVLAPTLPFVLPQSFLVFVLRYGPTERGTSKLVEISLVDADGAVLFPIRANIEISADSPPAGEVPQVVGLTGLVLPRYGDYAFHLSINGEPKSEMRFSVASPDQLMPPLNPST